MSFRAALAALGAVLFSALILQGVGVFSPASALAQTVAPSADVLDEREVFRLRKFLEKTKPSDFVSPSDSAVRQRAVTTAARSRVPSLAPHLITKGGLAGVAAGIWIHNGITLYHGLQGDAAPPPLVLDTEFRQAEYDLNGINMGAAITKGYVNGVVTGSGMLTKVRYAVQNGQCTVTATMVGKSSAAPNQSHFGYTGVGAAGSASVGCSSGRHWMVTPTTGNLASGQEFTSPAATAGTTGMVQIYTYDSNGGVGPKNLGAPFPAKDGWSWANPVYDWGSTSVAAAPGPNNLEVQAPETNAIYNDVQSQTCTPEAPPTEVCPDFFPEEWEDEYPTDPNGDPAAEPYADPDKDGQPNHSDPDDDNDGIPDEQDPVITPLPITDPNADPDEDGDPNKTDPDDDNDGIPDADDPEPSVPTDPSTLPVEHPYGDPDADGIPNKDDPDDDGDGDPDTTDPAPTDPAVESPDTDGDGIPDRDDEDDDNDGTPDVDDPAPTDPTEDGDLDKDGLLDPNDGDQDGDNIPDWEDVGERDKSSPVAPTAPALDGDEDGIPDWSDPWPGNPYAPAEPTRDDDLDKVPDYKDPVIGDPAVPMQPWPPGSPGDSPGNPGKPNIPSNPPNTNYPTSPTMPADPANPSSWPSDPTSPVSTSTPINPAEPMPPGEAGGPPPGFQASCPVCPVAKFDLPKMELASVFPFSLLLWVWSALGQLAAPPVAPSFDFGQFGVISLGGSWSGAVGMIRTAIGLLCLCGMLLWFYKSITGKGGEA